MYIVKKIVVKSTISLFVGIASAVGTQMGLTIWNKYLNDMPENKVTQSLKSKGGLA